MLFQVQLNIQTQQLAARLEYFTFLEQAQRMLNYPGDNLVLSEGFLSMVERLDGCLQYLRVHVSVHSVMSPHIADPASFTARFQGCRCLLDKVSTMHDPKYDSYQDVLCQRCSSARGRSLQENQRQSESLVGGRLLPQPEY